MPRPMPNTFNAPSSDKVMSYLSRHSVTRPSRWVVWLPAMLMGLAVLMVLTSSDSSVSILVWMVLLVTLFVSAGVRARGLKQVHETLAQVQEFTMRRNPVQALRSVWKLIPMVRTEPQMHAKAVALLAHNLQQVHAYDASVIAFEHVIDKLAPEHPAALQLRLQRVMSLLASDQLTDADMSLRKLRYVVDSFPNSMLSAGFYLAEIYQQIRTNHFAEVLVHRHDAMTHLRPLGMDAASGYAMLALACYSMRHTEPTLLAEASQWWENATLLMDPAVLVKNYRELQVIAQGPRAAAIKADGQTQAAVTDEDKSESASGNDGGVA